MAPDDARNLLAAEWSRNEAELQGLHDNPDTAGRVDPAARERELLRRQDEIEHDIGQAALDEARKRAAEDNKD